MKEVFFRISTFLALAFGCPVVGLALDFTPTETRTIEDGMPMKRSAFHEGEKAIFFRPPKAWTMFGGDNEISFSPPPSLEGEIRMGNSPLSPSIRFDEEGLPAYRAAARSQLPRDADKVEILSEATNAFPLDDWQSLEIRFSYISRGTKKTRSVLFVTMTPQRQVRLVADSNERQFEEVYGAARALLGSWFEPPSGWPGLAAMQPR